GNALEFQSVVLGIDRIGHRNVGSIALIPTGRPAPDPSDSWNVRDARPCLESPLSGLLESSFPSSGDPCTGRSLLRPPTCAAARGCPSTSRRPIEPLAATPPGRPGGAPALPPGSS